MFQRSSGAATQRRRAGPPAIAAPLELTTGARAWPELMAEHGVDRWEEIHARPIWAPPESLGRII